MVNKTRTYKKSRSRSRSRSRTNNNPKFLVDRKKSRSRSRSKSRSRSRSRSKAFSRDRKRIDKFTDLRSGSKSGRIFRKIPDGHGISDNMRKENLKAAEVRRLFKNYRINCPKVETLVDCDEKADSAQCIRNAYCQAVKNELKLKNDPKNLNMYMYPTDTTLQVPLYCDTTEGNYNKRNRALCKKLRQRGRQLDKTVNGGEFGGVSNRKNSKQIQYKARTLYNPVL